MAWPPVPVWSNLVALDTNLLSRQDKNPRIRNWIMQHYLQLAISSITVGEIAQGIQALRPSKRKTKLGNLLKELLEDYTVLPFGTCEALEWGRYVNAVARPVPIMDSIIAATARANNLEVVTENTKDFPEVPVVNPAED